MEISTIDDDNDVPTHIVTFHSYVFKVFSFIDLVAIVDATIAHCKIMAFSKLTDNKSENRNEIKVICHIIHCLNGTSILISTMIRFTYVSIVRIEIEM